MPHLIGFTVAHGCINFPLALDGPRKVVVGPPSLTVDLSVIALTLFQGRGCVVSGSNRSVFNHNKLIVDDSIVCFNLNKSVEHQKDV